MNAMKVLASVGTAVALCGSAAAQPTVDGFRDASYGAPLWVQNQPTGFGDNDDPSRDFANGSELNALYAQIVGDRLFVILTGNLETNFNKLDLFFDVRPGGQNPLRGDNVDIDFNGLNRMGQGDVGDPPVPAPGLTFDDGFFADYWLSVTNGVDDGNALVFGNAAVLRTDGPILDFNGNALDYGAYDGGLKTNFDPIPFAGPRLDIQDGFTPSVFCNYGPRLASDSLQANPLNPVGTPDLIHIAIDNSNIDGVTGDSVGDPAAVETGIEFFIELEELGWDGESPIKIAGFINASGHDFVSNQVIGGLPAPDNLGEPRLINFQQIDGSQFVVIPTDPDCPPDWNGDGVVDSDDLFDFLADWAAGNADYNGDGVTDSDDLFDFLADWSNPGQFPGCN